MFFTRITIRLKLCYNILFNKYRHYIVINVDKKNLRMALSGEDFEVGGYYHGLQPYGYWLIIKNIAASKDDDDMILEKAKFEADAVEKGYLKE